ncbi:hypothetical protein IMCC3317_42900 [Kordia antarctica]|uniref:Uncharacterized protein n=1 Tax=Kordia antarctica TaxID=1218801 RepID=A0A7L4ZQV7_9FLAO|nr:hypothetical protein [Kordia antarctica]QHI38890.1 hypothetical protein IMCC3317_42900 [Kordia antarctica]
MKNKKLHINKNSGFTTPKDYFETFEDRLFDSIKTETIIPKEEGFKVPDTYFDGLEDSLSAQLFSSENETKVIPLNTKKSFLKYIGYAAAACVLFLGAINFFQDETVDNSIDSVVNSEINTFIENDLIALNNYELMTAFEEENIDVSSLFEVSLNETETIDYLENTIDPYDLLIE